MKFSNDSQEDIGNESANNFHQRFAQHFCNCRDQRNN